MSTTSVHRDPRVDAYLVDAAPFARPILAHLRSIVHAACPDVVEDIKWRMPFFLYRGNLCHMAAFKAHCAFGFWRGNEIPGLPTIVGERAMGSFGRILSIDDLPPKRRLTQLVKTAMKLNEIDRKPARAAVTTGEPAIPGDLAAALAANPEATRVFAGLGATERRDYVDWVGAAKRDATRAARIATAVDLIAAGRTHRRSPRP